LVAIIDARDPEHRTCRVALERISTPLLTTWPAFTEAMYLLGAGGWRAQRALWDRLEDGSLAIADDSDVDRARVRRLMEQYSDLPMDLADATLVALAEALGTRRVFTLDSDFRVYRYKGRLAFELVPADAMDRTLTLLDEPADPFVGESSRSVLHGS
jgi:predicted nucleic acid-binding protein